MKYMSVLKLVFLSVVVLTGLTLLTVEPPKKITKGDILLSDLPKTVELIGFENKEFAANSIVKQNTVVFVGNFESIVLAGELEKRLSLKAGEFVIVSNVSDAPWFIKRWQAHTKNTKLKGDKHLPWIYDKNGQMRNFLKVPTSDSVKYFVYYVDNKGLIKRIYNGKVKQGTIEGAMSALEIEENLKPVVKLIQELVK
ncbi:MAG: hypothetical protein U9Q33_05665 [Campylobacterota bacterium]|nr:hypothetical protein [Campylobacterota bacterium]